MKPARCTVAVCCALRHACGLREPRQVFMCAVGRSSCGAAIPTRLPMVSDHLTPGTSVWVTVSTTFIASNYTNVRRCAFKGRRECAAVSIVEHRSRTGSPYCKIASAVQLLLSLAWRAAVILLFFVHAVRIYSVLVMRPGQV